MTPTRQHPALETWTPERQKEVNESTPENPVHLTKEEYMAMSHNYLAMGLGEGRFLIPAEPDSPADKALKLQDKGMNTAAIAAELDLSVGVVRRILRSTS